jgi:hypothetical protein
MDEDTSNQNNYNGTVYFEEPMTAEDIFSDFDIQNESMHLNSQIVDCSFSNLEGEGNMIEITSNTNLYVKGVKVENINSRIFNLMDSTLSVDSSNFTDFEYDNSGALILVNPGVVEIKNSNITRGSSSSGQIYASGFTSNVTI